jgi:hypothetical protein
MQGLDFKSGPKASYASWLTCRVTGGISRGEQFSRPKPVPTQVAPRQTHKALLGQFIGVRPCTTGPPTGAQFESLRDAEFVCRQWFPRRIAAVIARDVWAVGRGVGVGCVPILLIAHLDENQKSGTVGT